VFCFGASNMGHKDHFLHAYIYQEGEAKKGGNNVASLLVKHLVDEQFIDSTQGPCKELSIVMDNCGGQNKNCMVLQLALLFVELGWYKKVNFIFLIAGHTQNSCDRLFNILKLKYQESDVFSIEGKGGLIELLNECNLVHAVHATKLDFKDYDKFLDQIYKNMSVGTVNCSHFFQSSLALGAGQFHIHDTTFADSLGSNQNMLKNMNAGRQALLESFPNDLDTIIPS